MMGPPAVLLHTCSCSGAPDGSMYRIWKKYNPLVQGALKLTDLYRRSRPGSSY